jgi:hypothetical protein
MLTATIRMKVRRGTLAQWQTANPTLLHGEVGLVHAGGAGTSPSGFVFGNGADDFNTLWAVTAQKFAPGQASGDMLKSVYDSLDNGTVNSARVAYEVAWADVTGKPAIITEQEVRTWWGEPTTKGQMLAYDDQLGEFTPIVAGDPSQVLAADPNAAAGVVWVTLPAAGDMFKSVYDSLDDGTVNSARVAYEVAWTDVTGKPAVIGDMLTSTYDPDQDGVVLAADVAYEVDWADITNKPAVIGDMLKSVYDTNDNGIVDASEREQIEVINKTGATVPKGTIVYLKTSSASGNFPEIELADAVTESGSSKTIGGVYEDIDNNDTGFVVTSGQVHNLDTSGFDVGDRLWLSTIPGQVTTTPPASPNNTVFIGIITRKQNGNGRVLYAIQNGYELAELHDVADTAPSSGDVLTYNGTTSLWEPASPAPTGPTTAQVFAITATF